MVKREDDIAKRGRGRPPKQPRNISENANKVRVACGVRESAQLLGIGVTSLYELLSAAEIRSFCVGTRRLIPFSELQRFVASKLA